MITKNMQKFLTPTHIASYYDSYDIDEDSLTDENINNMKKLQIQGKIHEKLYLKKLKNNGNKIAIIPETGPFKYRSELTLKAITKGYDVIYQAALINKSWRGYADFLIKCKTESKLNKYNYEVLDTKLTLLPKPKHIIQLCSYSDMLSKIQGVLPEHMYIVLGNGEKHSFKTNEFIAYFKHIKTQFENNIKNNNTAKISSNFFYYKHKNKNYDLNDSKMIDNINGEKYKKIKVKNPILRKIILKLNKSINEMINIIISLKEKNIQKKYNNNNHNTNEETYDIELKKIYEEYYKMLVENHKKPPQLNILIADLLEFHWRENKTQNELIASWKNKNIKEILKDGNCIANLKITKTEEENHEEDEDIYTYKFPPQDYKLEIGNRVLNTTNSESIGTIWDINDRNKIIKLTPLDNQTILPSNLSIGLEEGVSSDILSKAVYQYADLVINNKHHNYAITDFLNHTPPKTKNYQKSKSENNQFMRDLWEKIINLNNSYLFIQGPPGTGKTHKSSEIIIELIKRGKKIGITSNSHKAINNLLKAIENRSKEQNVKFYGLKKYNTSNNDSFFSGKHIKNFEDFEEKNINFNANLFAGTAWLFADKYLNGKIDYLFVDEAGQVALANLVAMSKSTKNLILIGDQMQLAQPIKASHPRKAGLSTLDFFMQGTPIINENYGVFLNQTHRLHPKICTFISETFYNGKLKFNQNNKLRQLKLQKSMLPNQGIALIPVKHKNCSTKSNKEGKIIKNIYNELLNNNMAKRTKIKNITHNDILVVAPFNAQVNYLKTILPENARVGTVDKFQGQEAPIVLISMTTSDAKKDQFLLDFLYNPNRLNVAISRAQCLSVITISTELLEVPPASIHLMKLVNNFCRLNQYAKIINV